VGNYDELDTARLTWVVLDRLVPPDDEAAARAALIRRDPELASLVARGDVTEDEAIARLRERQPRHRDPDEAIRWVAPVAAGLVVLFLALLVVTVLRSIVS